MELQNFNPWWRDGKVSPEFLGRKRKIFSKIIKYIENKLQKALLITLDTETKFQKEKIMVEAIPYWRYWSIKSEISLK